MANFADQIQEVLQTHPWLHGGWSNHGDGGQLKVCIMGAAGLAISMVNDMVMPGWEAARFFSGVTLEEQLAILPKDLRREVCQALFTLRDIILEQYPERVEGYHPIAKNTDIQRARDILVTFNDWKAPLGPEPFSSPRVKTTEREIIGVLEEASRRIEAAKRLPLVIEPE